MADDPPASPDHDRPEDPEDPEDREDRQDPDDPEGREGREGREDREDREGSADAASRPTPVRRGLASARSRPTPVREAASDEGQGGESDPDRPTPVRQAMEAEREPTPTLEPPSLTFQQGDDEWIVRLEGRTTSGQPGDAGAPLLFLTFARSDDPERREREVVGVGRELEDLTPGDLGRLLSSARPYRGDWEGAELFPETRRNRSSGR